MSVLPAALVEEVVVTAVTRKCLHGVSSQIRRRELYLYSAHIFLLAAVMSRDALMTRSRLSWCSSSSARKASNIGMKGEEGGGFEWSMISA